MTQYKTTISLIDKLIARLEANTGGEPLFPEQIAQPVAAQNLTKQETQSHIKEQNQQKKEVVDKKEGNKKVKGQGKKQNTKPQVEKPKLPEGVDEQILIFSEVDLRISQIVDCWKHPQSQKLYCQKILVGKQLREIASGLQEYVKLQDMKGKVIVMANLKPKSLGGFNSNGMVVCASDKQHKTVQLLVPEGQLGERLYLQGFQDLFKAGQEIIPIVKKSKVLQKTFEHFKTNAQGYVIWKGYKLRTKAGYIKSNIIDGNVS